jgi:hypothetical protein
MYNAIDTDSVLYKHAHMKENRSDPEYVGPHLAGGPVSQVGPYGKPIRPSCP